MWAVIFGRSSFDTELESFTFAHWSQACFVVALFGQSCGQNCTRDPNLNIFILFQLSGRTYNF